MFAIAPAGQLGDRFGLAWPGQIERLPLAFLPDLRELALIGFLLLVLPGT